MGNNHVLVLCNISIFLSSGKKWNKRRKCTHRTQTDTTILFIFSPVLWTKFLGESGGMLAYIHNACTLGKNSSRHATVVIIRIHTLAFSLLCTHIGKPLSSHFPLFLHNNVSSKIKVFFFFFWLAPPHNYLRTSLHSYLPCIQDDVVCILTGEKKWSTIIYLIIGLFWIIKKGPHFFYHWRVTTLEMSLKSKI